MTSLYQVAFSKAPVRTKTDKKVEVERYYYLDMNKAVLVDADIMDAIVGVSADRTIRGIFSKEILLDLRTPDLEYSQDMFPLNQIFDPKDWFYGWRDYCNANN